MFLSAVIISFAVALVAVTALALVPSDEWWIRVWDFPRSQIAALTALCLLGLGIAPVGRNSYWLWPLVIGLSVCLIFQLYRIWPFTALHRRQAKSTDGCSYGSEISLVTANVLRTNRNAHLLLRQIAQSDPDLVLLVETDAWWHAQLQPLKMKYPHQISHPSNDGYGMHLFSRLALAETELRFLLEDYVPSIKTRVHLPGGKDILLYCVHPKPPPRSDTARRDAELLIVAREVRAETTPTIVAGDLNDVAWSRTTWLFQEASGLLDPRIGRGIYPTFNANWLLLRWPLDHVFYSDSFLLRSLRILPHIGSDHFPLFVSLCLHAIGPQLQHEPKAELEDRKRVHDAIRDGRTKARSGQT